MNKEATYRRPDGIAFRWNGLQTVNVYRAGENIDCFSLDYSRNDHTMSEVVRKCDEWEASW